MIYQHRLVISRGGRLSKRHEVFQGDSMKVIESHGSVLVGAWEVWIGAEAGSSVYQIRQFDSLAAWEQHQQRLRDDAAHDERRVSQLYTLFDFCDTSILRLNPRSPALPQQWPSFDAVQGQPRGVFEQRTIWLRPDGTDRHHETYFDQIQPALEREGSRVVAFFDTVIGPGTTNGRSHRSIELRHFTDMGAWQRWREAQESDPALWELTRQVWPSLIDRMDSLLLKPLDYSRIR
jgi:hypothetical protein